MNGPSGNKCKKILRKQIHFQARLERDPGIIFSDTPTKYMVICNAGLSNGLGSEIVLENFRKFGTIEDVHMLPGKSFCYVVFQTSDVAERAFLACNGQLEIGQNNKPLYLAYAKELTILSYPPNTMPVGLQVIEEVITPNEELFFKNLILTSQETSTSIETMLKHRYVKHFGYEFNYDTNNVDVALPIEDKIPSECHKLFALMGFVPDQLTANCYKPGQGIPPHVDTHSAFEDSIASLSLGSNVIMEFRHSNGSRASILLPRRSLAIMRGESRYDWTHGITPRMFDMIKTTEGISIKARDLRISYTFRKVNVAQVCSCSYPSKCDSQQSKTMAINDLEARKLEHSHVKQVYNTIAKHFSDTRHTPWPNVLGFVNSFPIGSILIDIGCGNGKNIGHNVNNFEIGCDNSTGLLQLCRERQFEVFACNCLHVPLRNAIADGAISIAVIHHLGNATRRRQAIAEIARLLRVGGKALIYVWARNQSRGEKSSYLKQDRRNRKGNIVETANSNELVKCDANVELPVHTNRKQFAAQDLLVPWTLKTDASCTQAQHLRFYHVFEDDELKQLCSDFDNIQIIQYYYDQGNWCIIFEKIKDDSI